MIAAAIELKEKVLCCVVPLFAVFTCYKNRTQTKDNIIAQKKKDRLGANSRKNVDYKRNIPLNKK